MPGFGRHWFCRFSVHQSVVYPRHSRTWQSRAWRPCCAETEPLLSFPEKLNLLYFRHTFSETNNVIFN